MSDRVRPSANGAAPDPTDRLVARAGRAAATRAHELETGLSWHLDRLRVASANARHDLEAGSTARRARLTRALAVPSVGGRQVHRVLDKLRKQGRRSRVAVTGAVVVAVVAATGALVATQGDPGDRRAQRSTSNSIARQSTSTAGTTARSSDAAPDTQPAPASDPALSAGPTSLPGVPGATAAPQTQPPGSTRAPAGTSPPPPGAVEAPPNSGSPPTTQPPGSPMCQLLPVVCP